MCNPPSKDLQTLNPFDVLSRISAAEIVRVNWPETIEDYIALVGKVFFVRQAPPSPVFETCFYISQATQHPAADVLDITMHQMWLTHGTNGGFTIHPPYNQRITRENKLTGEGWDARFAIPGGDVT